MTPPFGRPTSEVCHLEHLLLGSIASGAPHSQRWRIMYLAKRSRMAKGRNSDRKPDNLFDPLPSTLTILLSADACRVAPKIRQGTRQNSDQKPEQISSFGYRLLRILRILRNHFIATGSDPKEGPHWPEISGCATLNK